MISCHLTRWMGLEGIMLSDINQTERGKYYYDLTSMSNLKKQKKT